MDIDHSQGQGIQSDSATLVRLGGAGAKYSALLLEFHRGRGVSVAGRARQKSLVLIKSQELLKIARHEGYRREELVRLIEDLP
jgi:hypothetical protein